MKVLSEAIGLPSLCGRTNFVSKNTRFMQIFKVVGGQMASKGHMIALEHDGRELFRDNILPHLSLENKLFVAFVGSESEWRNLVRDSLELQFHLLKKDQEENKSLCYRGMRPSAAFLW